MKAFMKGLLCLIMASLLAACGSPYQASGADDSSSVSPGGSDATPDVPDNSGGSTNPNPPQPGKGPFSNGYIPEPLIWENNSHPERTSWSSALYDLVSAKFSVLDQAQDIEFFCPTYDQLNKDQKINLWADVIAATTFYESGYNPKIYAVDVGTEDNPDTWSVGLLQLSVVDQKNYGFSFGYKFADLQNPVKNLTLGMSIFSRQISKYGIVLIPVGGKGLYWAVLHPGGKYDASAKIAKMTQQLSFCQ